MALVRVVIVNYNGGTVLARCLASLAAQTFREFEAVVVDNASNDGSGSTPLPDSRFRLLQLDRNAGFAEGNNLGAEGAEAEFIALLNPDAFPEPNWLEELVSAARASQAVMFGSTQISDADDHMLDGTGDQYFAAGMPYRGGFRQPLSHLPAMGEPFCPCAAAAMYRRDWFFKAGGFDTRFFCYCEDVDLGFRLRLMGGRCLQVPTARVRHVGSAITGGDMFFVRYHNARNRLWLFVRNMPGWLFWLMLPVHALISVALILRAMVKSDGAATLAGFADGISALPQIWQTRRTIQSHRRVSVLDIARVLTWSPLKWLKRRADY